MFQRAIYKGKKSILLLILLLLFGYSVANGILQVSEDISLGGLIRIFLPSVFILGLLTVALLEDIRRLISLPDIKLKQFILLIVIALSIAYPVLKIASDYSLTYSIAGIITSIGLIASLYFAISGYDIYGLAIFIITMPFLAFLEWDFRYTPFSGRPLGPIMLSPSIIFVIILFSLLVIKKVFRKEKLVRTPLDKYIGAFGFFLFLSSIVSAEPTISFREFFMNILYFPLFFFLIVNSVRTKNDLILLFSAIGIYTFLRIFIIYYLFIRVTYATLTPTIILRAEELFEITVNIGVVSTISLMGIPIGAILTFLSPSKLRRLLFSFILFSLVIILILCVERAHLISLAITTTIILLFFAKGKLKRYLIGGVIVGMISIFFLPKPVFDPLVSRFEEWNSIDSFISNQEARLDAVKSAGKMLLDRPAFGIGLGMWSRYYPTYSQNPARYFRKDYQLRTAHNFFLHYGTAGGLGALIILILLVARVIKEALSTFSISKDPVIYNLALISFWSFLTFTIVGFIGGLDSLTAGSMWVPIIDIGMFIWLIVGCIFALGRIVKHKESFMYE